MQIEQAIFKLLTTSSGVTGLVNGRIYPEFAPQRTRMPFITYQRVSSEHYHHMTAASGLVKVRIQVDCYSDSFSEVRDLADKVRLALDGYSGSVTVGSDSLALEFVHLDGENDLGEAPSAGAEQGAQRVSMDFVAAAAETVPTF